MKSSVTLIPYGGLANRMKAVEALIVLIQDTRIQGYKDTCHCNLV